MLPAETGLALRYLEAEAFSQVQCLLSAAYAHRHIWVIAIFTRDSMVGTTPVTRPALQAPIREPSSHFWFGVQTVP